MIQESWRKLPIYTAILTTVVVVPALADPTNLPKLWIQSLGSTLCLFLLLRNFSKTEFKLHKSLFIISGIFIFALVFAMLASNQSFYRSLIGTWGRNNGFIGTASVLILFFTMSLVRGKDNPVRLLDVLVKLGFFNSIYGTFQFLDADPISWVNEDNRIILTLGNSNFASAFLSFTAIATFSRLLNFSQIKFRYLLILASFIIQLFLIVESDALQGLIVTILSCAIVFGIWLRTYIPQKFRFVTPLYLISSGVVLTFVISGIFSKGPLTKFLSGSFYSLHDRYYHWLAAIKMVANEPIFGVGLDAYGDYYRKFRLEEAINLRGTAGSSTNNAHNVFAQLGATGGLTLLIAYLLLIGFVILRAVKVFKVDSENRLLIGTLLAIWIAYLTQSAVSIDKIGLAIWGWLSAGSLVGLSYSKQKGNKDKVLNKVTSKPLESKKLTKKDFILISIIVLVPAIFSTSALVNSFLIQTKISNVYNSSTEAIMQQNVSDLFNFSKDLKEPETRLMAVKVLIMSNNLDLALELSEQTANEFPKSFSSWDQIARIYEGTGRKDFAVKAREMTLRLDPLNQEIRELFLEDTRYANLLK